MEDEKKILKGRLKLQITSEEYKELIDEKTGEKKVLAELRAILVVPSFTKKHNVALQQAGEYGRIFPGLYKVNRFFHVSGTATLGSDDEYDVNIGKKIARAKAENKLQAIAIKRLKRYISELRAERDEIISFFEKAFCCLDSNLKYIDKFN